MARPLSAARAALLPFCLLSVSAHAIPSPDSGCWKADEQRAAEVHNFQTMLMVGALKCRNSVPAALDGYNSFMSSKRDLIVANQYVLMGHFIREYGDSNGLGAFRRYETHVGNKHSGADNLARCEAIGAMSRMAAGASETDLRELARLVGEDSLTATCPSMALADEGLAPAVEATLKPEEQPALADETAPALVPAATDLAAKDAVAEPVVDAPAPVQAPVAAEVPVQVASASGSQPKVVTVEETPAPEPSAAQALQEAARALALAANALQAQAAGPASASDSSPTELAKAPN
jgi:hypothetical protein